MENSNLKFGTFFWRVSSSHMITYTLTGLIASTALNYEGLFATPPLSYLMKPTDSAWVAAGPVLQIIRGLIFSVALWFFKDVFLFKKNGWLKLWLLIAGLSTLSATGPTPGSVEGFIYTKIPVTDQLRGYIEVIPQTMLFSLFVFYWYEKPKRIWNILSIILVLIIVIMCVLGLLFR
jgi:hypothetical protein